MGITVTARGEGRLQAELFGLRVLVMQCLCFIAARTDNPADFLESFGRSAVAGLEGAPGHATSSARDRMFRTVAADVVRQCVGAAQDVVRDVPQRHGVQDVPPPMGMDRS